MSRSSKLAVLLYGLTAGCSSDHLGPRTGGAGISASSGSGGTISTAGDGGAAHGGAAHAGSGNTNHAASSGADSVDDNFGGLAGTGGSSGGSAVNGGGGSGGNRGEPTDAHRPLKGIAFTGSTCADIDRLGLSWFYDWGTSSNCMTNAQFVPMIWGGWSAATDPTPPEKVAAAGHKIVLGFNEPDHADQANMTVSAALALWPAMNRPEFDRVGSPAAASDGQAWFEQFMKGVEQQGLRVDFIALHWYGWSAGSCSSVDQLESYIHWAEQWNKPLWLTEWSCRLQSADITRRFFVDAVAMFAKHPLLERYAWFLTRTSTDENFATATLLDANGNPTGLGTDYTNAPAFH